MGLLLSCSRRHCRDCQTFVQFAADDAKFETFSCSVDMSGNTCGQWNLPFISVDFDLINCPQTIGKTTTIPFHSQPSRRYPPYSSITHGKLTYAITGVIVSTTTFKAPALIASGTGRKFARVALDDMNISPVTDTRATVSVISESFRDRFKKLALNFNSNRIAAASQYLY